MTHYHNERQERLEELRKQHAELIVDEKRLDDESTAIELCEKLNSGEVVL